MHPPPTAVLLFPLTQWFFVSFKLLAIFRVLYEGCSLFVPGYLTSSQAPWPVLHWCLASVHSPGHATLLTSSSPTLLFPKTYPLISVLSSKHTHSGPVACLPRQRRLPYFSPWVTRPLLGRWSLKPQLMSTYCFVFICFTDIQSLVISCQVCPLGSSWILRLSFSSLWLT